jgi:hypothetical protein
MDTNENDQSTAKEAQKLDIEINQKEAQELHDLAKSIVDNNPGFAWWVVDAWLKKNNSLLVPADFHGTIHTKEQLEKMIKE